MSISYIVELKLKQSANPYIPYLVERQDETIQRLSPANDRVVHNLKKNISTLNQLNKMSRIPRVFLANRPTTIFTHLLG